jgi:hypothetical protein
MGRVAVPLDRARVAAIHDQEEATYRARTPRSAALHDRARRAMPPMVEMEPGAHRPT